MQWLYQAHKQKKEEIRQRLSDFSRVKGDGIFYELCYCLMTPQSNGKRCDEAAQALIKQNFLSSDVKLAPLLKQKTRFHNNKARYLDMMKKMYPQILAVLHSGQDPHELRAWLVEHVKGMGMKEASHFLRNIGYRRLAILDRHILKNLVKCNALTSLPRALTMKTYLDIEQLFRQFSEKIGIDMDELDLLFWSEETGEIFK